ncbi:MAG: methionyl-tRNA formyltransferase [Planctomycetota bacterium]
MGLKVVFFGTPEFARVVLGGLLDSPHEVVAAVAAPDRPSGRGRKVREGPVSAFARERGVTLLQPARLDKDARVRLADLGADVFAVASYGRIFGPKSLAIPRLGAVNAHGSVLPKLRGAAPVERAIMEGFTRTGISVQQMVREVDAGDVYASREIPIDERENAESLRARLAGVAAELLPEVLSAIKAGTARAEPQDASLATFAPPLLPDERAIRWGDPAAATANRIRAFAPKPGAFALLPPELGSKRLKVLDAIVLSAPAPDAAPSETLLASTKEGLLVAAGEGEALRLVTVQPEGKRPMGAAAFLSGHRVAAGQTFGNGI